MTESRPWWQDLPRTSFGSPALEERLAALILAGRKRATVWNAREGNPTAPGMRWVVTAGGRDVAVIETQAVGRCRFDEIDAAFAFEEGEGDRGLAFWRAAHESFFRNEGEFRPDMELCWERFTLVEALDHDLAAAAEAHVAAEETEVPAYLAALSPTGDSIRD